MNADPQRAAQDPHHHHLVAVRRSDPAAAAGRWRCSSTAASANIARRTPAGRRACRRTQAEQVRGRAARRSTWPRTSTPPASSSALLFVMLLGVDHGDQRVLPPDRDHHVPDHAAPDAGDPGQAGRRGRCSASVFWLVTTAAQPDRRADHPERAGRRRRSSASRAIWRAIVLNVLAFVLWAILGVGLGRADPQPDRRDPDRWRVLYLIGTIGAGLSSSCSASTGRRTGSASCRCSCRRSRRS